MESCEFGKRSLLPKSEIQVGDVSPCDIILSFPEGLLTKIGIRFQSLQSRESWSPLMKSMETLRSLSLSLPRHCITKAQHFLDTRNSDLTLHSRSQSDRRTTLLKSDGKTREKEVYHLDISNLSWQRYQELWLELRAVGFFPHSVFSMKGRNAMNSVSSLVFPGVSSWTEWTVVSLFSSLTWDSLRKQEEAQLI
jgi:hypothetical protein